MTDTTDEINNLRAELASLREDVRDLAAGLRSRGKSCRDLSNGSSGASWHHLAGKAEGYQHAAEMVEALLRFPSTPEPIVTLADNTNAAEVEP